MTTAEQRAIAARLKAERERRGWGQRKMARFLRDAVNDPQKPELPSFVTYVKRWESGKVPVTDSRYRTAYAAVFGMDENELFGRREVIAAGVGMVGLLLTGHPVDHLTAGRRIGMSTVDRLRERAVRLRNLDDYLGGADTYRLYLAELEATQGLLNEGAAGETVRRELLALVAEQAQQAGWAAFDAGWHDIAAALYETARAAAVDADDAALEGNSLAYRAYQMGADGADMATASYEIAAEAPCRVRALLLERAAWAHAVAGRPAETDRLLGRATEALAADRGQAPHWASWVDEVELQIMAGRCWTELHRPLRAVPALESALARYDDSHARDKALYLTWLGAAYLDGREIERACVAIGRAMELATGVASVRPRQRVRVLLGRMSPYRSTPEVADLMDRAHDWLTVSSTS
ncbi:helix-turn-helix domain-containing protein [Thermomonospora amylolytica]|uniref:helix-turn-helix domain-containing protein n=1 Tax=Thermomonospora amylolytica TaxID=1411117 RepID=UPI0013002A43|nr:helix-turn-helix transcriptional regulator [Thermomonospora amylolytica]